MQEQSTDCINSVLKVLIIDKDLTFSLLPKITMNLNLASCGKRTNSLAQREEYKVAHKQLWNRGRH